MVLVAIGILGLLTGLLQPWASCPEVDDSSAGCPAGTVTRVVTISGLALAGLGTVLASSTAASRRREERARA